MALVAVLVTTTTFVGCEASGTLAHDPSGGAKTTLQTSTQGSLTYEFTGKDPTSAAYVSTLTILVKIGD